MSDLQNLELAATYTEHTCNSYGAGHESQDNCVACRASSYWNEVTEIASQAVHVLRALAEAHAQGNGICICGHNRSFHTNLYGTCYYNQAAYEETTNECSCTSFEQAASSFVARKEREGQ